MEIKVSGCHECPCCRYDPESGAECALATDYDEDIEDEEVKVACDGYSIPDSCPLKNEGFIEILPEEEEASDAEG